MAGGSRCDGVARDHNLSRSRWANLERTAATCKAPPATAITVTAGVRIIYILRGAPGFSNERARIQPRIEGLGARN